MRHDRLRGCCWNAAARGTSRSRESWAGASSGVSNFAVTAPMCLDPRPETEVRGRGLAGDACHGPEAKLRAFSIWATGSGCILLALLVGAAARRSGLGVDSSRSRACKVRKRATPRHSGSVETVPSFDRSATGRRALRVRWQAIVSNPPYIVESRDRRISRPRSSRFDPRQALSGGPDGLDAYRSPGCRRSLRLPGAPRGC